MVEIANFGFNFHGVGSREVAYHLMWRWYRFEHLLYDTDETGCPKCQILLFSVLNILSILKSVCLCFFVCEPVVCVCLYVCVSVYMSVYVYLCVCKSVFVYVCIVYVYLLCV